MSKWGLTYKGTEVLFPEDWNHVVDALQELDGRTPVRVGAGLGTWSGDGTTTTFVVTHNWGEMPTVAFVQPASADAVGDFYVTLDENTLKIVYKTAPPSGTDNVKLYYIIMKF